MLQEVAPQPELTAGTQQVSLSCASFPRLSLSKPSSVISERVRHVSSVFGDEVAAIWNLADPEPLSLKAPVLGGKKPERCKASKFIPHCVSHCVIDLG